MSYSTGKPRTKKGNWFICLFGDPGVGKTTLCAYAPPPVHWIDTGNETMILAYTPDVPQPEAVYGCHEPKDVGQVMLDIKTGKIKNVGTLVLDNMSDFAHMQLKESAEKLKTGRDRMPGVFVPTQEDYLILTSIGRNLALDFEKESFPCNVVVICHRLEETNDKTKRTTIRPDLSPKLSNQFMGKVDAELFYTLEVNQLRKEEIRTIRSRPTNIIEAKNRFDLPPEFPAADLWKLMEEKKHANNDPTGGDSQSVRAGS